MRRRARSPGADIPLSLKLSFSAFVLVWLPTVVYHHGWQNLLWLCDLANLLVLAGLWLGSPLLLSSQLHATLLIGIAWTVDLLTALVTGVHPFAATTYMFDPQIALTARMSSLFHVLVPLLLIYVLGRTGYDPRGLWLQTGICWLVLPLTALLTEPHRNINWVRAPFGIEQTLLPDWLYVLLCMAAYPVLLYLPAHGLARLAIRARRITRH